MGARGHIGDGVPASHRPDGVRREDEHPRQIFVPAAGEQHLLRLPLQGGHGNLGEAPASGCADGGVDSAQIHIRRHEEGHALEHGVPLGYVVGGRVVLAFQRRLGQPRSVVRRGHDLELHRPGTVAGQQVDGELEAAVRTAVGEQLGILPIHGALQLSEYALIAGPSEDKRPSYVPEPGGLVGERRQFIHQRHLSDADRLAGMALTPADWQTIVKAALPSMGKYMEWRALWLFPCTLL